MPDSFTLPNPTPPSSPSGSAATASLKLSDVVHQQQDAIVFEGSRIPRLAGVPDAFIIFYLTEQDEQNGFGTVIQLDPTTKQAAIFSDLNPEYAYLFFTDDQGQLQTLLSCIEFATRTPDGLYVTQAKIHGQGVTSADMQRLSQIQVPAQPASPEHQLAEADPLPPPTHNAPLPADAFIDQAPVMPAAPPVPAVPAPVVAQTEEPELQLPPLPPLPAAPAVLSTPTPQPLDATIMPAAPRPAVAPASQTVINPSPPRPTQAQPAAPMAPPAQPIAASPATNVVIPSTPATPLPTPQPDWNQPRPAQVNPDDQLTSLPDLPTNMDLLGPVQAPETADWEAQDPGSVAVESLSLSADLNSSLDQLPAIPQSAPAPAVQVTQPMSQLKPLMPQGPAMSNAAKLPVGRPPKPLTQDQSWMIEPQDFTWLKQISREPLEAHKDELRQKIIKQIRKNRPGLIDDWQFHGAFEQAFLAIAQTYDLVPALRHDLLKSLLNGKVVDQVVLQQQAQV